MKGLAQKTEKVTASLYEWEQRFWHQGINYICGVDEVGRGPLAGPVTAAAVILRPGVFISGLNDSKKLSPNKREKLADEIKEKSYAWAVGWSSVCEIDALNILIASRWAMSRAICNLQIKPEYLLIDGIALPSINIPQKKIIGGDSLSASIAAASILAKVARDELMTYYDSIFKGYGFVNNKGYPTSQHLKALELLGPSPIHRLSFRPVIKK
ncbi:MAG: ribonuclease [Clostridia bacterium]|nr:ribonuclease [Clostridia bacterium]